MSKIKKNYSLYRLMRKREVSIPDYQRGYVQGTENDERIEDIRKGFVSDLVAALKEHRQVHMGLVYGSKNDSTLAFSAVDGQQRLTTCFLLYLYLAQRLNLSDKFIHNFGWYGRIYASEFIEFMQQCNMSAAGRTLDFNVMPGYFRIWEKDPSVRGMIVMLQTLHSELYGCSETELQIMFNRLCGDSCPIVFDYLMLKDGTDEIQYMKMNTRGRELTTFEKFKNMKQAELSIEIANKMDEAWRAFFEDQLGENVEADIPLMNYINEHILLKHSIADEPEQFRRVAAYITESKPKGTRVDVGFVRREYYDLLEYENLEKEIDWFVSNYSEIKEGLGSLLFADEKPLWIFDNGATYATRAMHYAIIRYAGLTKYLPIKDDRRAFVNYLRPIHNLIFNTHIGIENFASVVKAIQQIKIGYNNYCNINAFNKEQREEETLKSGWIALNPALEQVFLEKEKDARFKGSIRMLLPTEKCDALRFEVISRAFDTLTNNRYGGGYNEYEFVKAMLKTGKINEFWKIQLKSWPNCFKDSGPVFDSIHQLLFDYVDCGKSAEDFLRDYPMAEKVKDVFWINFMLSEPCAEKSFEESWYGKLQWKNDALWLYYKTNQNDNDLLISNRRRDVIRELVGISEQNFSHEVIITHPNYQYLDVHFCGNGGIWVGIKQETEITVVDNPTTTGYHKAWEWFQENDFRNTGLTDLKDEFDKFCDEFIEKYVASKNEF